MFEKVFEVSEIAKFTREEYQSYEDSLKYYRDLNNSIDTAKLEEKESIARNLLNKGISPEIISDTTGLSKDQINMLKY